MEQDNDKDNDEFLKKQVRVYFKKKIPIHIRLENGEWLNGKIIEVSPEFLMLNEFKKGKLPIFFSQIIDINKFREIKNE